MPLAAKKILVPVRGTKAAEGALRVACRLAKQQGGKIFALYIIEMGHESPLDAEIPVEDAQAESVLERIEAMAREEKCPVEGSKVQARHAGPAIVQESIDRRMDLIVLGVGHRKHIVTRFLGEESDYILKNAPCPVLLWREALEEGMTQRD